MSQVPKLTRARQLAGSVWPGRTVDGYSNLIVARLRRLAATQSTGMLPFAGHCEGGVFFQDGLVVYAESSRTPGRPAGGLAPLGLVPGGTADLPPGPFGKLADMLAAVEPTVDATVELLSSESRYAKFRQAGLPAVPGARPIPLETLLAEAARRRQVLRQLSIAVTADTIVVRDTRLAAPRIKVTAPQWALLSRIGNGATPRGLAMELGRGVFATTIETYRLLVLRLLSVPGYDPPLGRGEHAAMSFTRALSEERGI
jgi:hypothetical protein